MLLLHLKYYRTRHNFLGKSVKVKRQIKITVMGKNKKKSKKSFLKGNKVLLAALGGITAGISLAGILGTEKAKKIADTLGSSVNEFTGKIKDQINRKEYGETFPVDEEIKSKKHTAEVV
jgi:hypothetical protein